MMRSGRETIKHRSRKKSAPFFSNIFFFFWVEIKALIHVLCRERKKKRNLQEGGIYLLCKRERKKVGISNEGVLCA
jgi:hypothetical protein